MTTINSRYIAYFRVSTDKQGIRGLGIESQKGIVEQHVQKMGGELVGDFLEVASGNKVNRIELTRALEECKRKKATLIVAKLDRLARDIHFISGLQKSKVKFVAADLPEANEMVIQIMAVMAEYERKLISERTKNALAILKSKGKKLGNPSLKPNIVEEMVKQANIFALRLKPTIEAFTKQGYTQKAIAQELTRMGVSTPAGCKRWTQCQISRVMKRLKVIA